LLTTHLHRWLEALSASLKSTRKLPGFDTRRTLVVGHSEGALMAAALAARHSFVTSVACLAMGGPNQLDDFFHEARIGNPEMQSLKSRWQEIQRHPTDHNRMWLGHAYPYCATFMTPSEGQLLSQTTAKVFIAKGSLDGTKPQQDLDYIEAKLLSQGRNIDSHLIEGANHGFQHPNNSSIDGWRDILSKVVDWFSIKPSEPNRHSLPASHLP